MTEIFFIIALIIAFLIITKIPFNYILQLEKNANYLDSKIFNLIFFLNFILFLNLLNLELELIKNICYIILFLTIIFNFYLFNKKKINNSEDSHLYLFLSFICVVISISLAYAPSLSWEAQTIWIEKVILLFQNNKIISLKNSPAAELPILLPAIWSFFWKLFNTNYEYFGRLFLVFLYLLSILNFIEIFKLKFYKKIILFLLSVLTTLKVNYFQGDPMILEFSLILLAIKYLYEILINKKTSKFNLIILFLLINLIIWNLNEGIFYSFIIISSLIFFNKNEKKNNFIIKIVISYIFLILFRIYILEIYNIKFSLNSDDYQFYNFIINFNFSNVILITKYILINSLRTEILLFSIPLIFYYFIFQKNSVGKKLNFYLILTNILFIYCFFLFNHETMEAMLKQKMIPLLFMSSPFYLLSVIILIKSKFKL